MAPVDRIEQVRAFNRFYTRRIGVLREDLLGSEFNLPQARVLFELFRERGGDGPEPAARELAAELELDPGYLSRLLSILEKRGLIRREPSSLDGRRRVLRLLPAGRRAAEDLTRRSREQLAGELSRLDEDEARDLVQAMGTITGLLEPDQERPVPAIVLRPMERGDLGWIVHRQALLYGNEYNWDATFEALIAGILARFVEEFDPERERSWIAELDARIAGSIFCVRDDDEVARLRLLYVEPFARGRGLGSRLVDECVRFARERGYRRMTLWTNDVLVSARRIYEAAGFQLTREEEHESFGHRLTSQHWDLEL